MIKPIDFKLVPVDTLVEVMSLHCGILTLHFKHQTDDGRYFCTNYTSATAYVNTCGEWANSYGRIRISAKNPWLPWFGGECPVPDDSVVQIKYRLGQNIDLFATVKNCNWAHTGYGSDIIAYRLCESRWQTVYEVWDY